VYSESPSPLESGHVSLHLQRVRSSPRQLRKCIRVTNPAYGMRQPTGREVLLRLLEGADALIENFKPGSMEAWGIGYEALKKRFPKLIYCKISGFGANGPLGGFPGYDGIVGAMTGHYSVNGSHASGPMRLGLRVVDISMGLYCVIGILI